MPAFQVVSEYTPSGDQPQAIAKLAQGIEDGLREQILLGVTGSGKTYTMAKVIEAVQRPTLVLAHNKTLAAQLCEEFKEFFPNNAVEYFVSYYDYYQPEAYIPHTDTFIEKDASINEEIDRLRLSATASLLERRDVIVVSSVSCIYGLGEPDDFEKMMVSLRVGDDMGRDALLHRLVDIRYERNDIAFERNMFRVRGDTVELWPAYWKDSALRVEFFGDEIDRISEINPVTGSITRRLTNIPVWPASHYVVSKEKMERALGEIERELDERERWLAENGKLVEAQRIRQRTTYDIEMMRELGYCNGIENYSRVISGRPVGSPPMTLIDYFPDDFVLFVDESHVTLPQVRAMFNGDRARKESLIEYGPALRLRQPALEIRRVPGAVPSGGVRLRHPGGVRAQSGGPDRGTGHPAHWPAGPQGGGPARGGTDRRPHRRDQRPVRPERAGAGDHPDQEDGGGPDPIPTAGGHQGAVYAPRRGDHRADGADPGPAAGRI
jgi:excinuclease ABC subunit B